MLRWDPNPDLFTIPVLNWPIKWYGVLFALGFAVGFVLFKNILYRYFLQREVALSEATLKQMALKVTDQITVWVVIATIIGARLGHFLFYEKPSDYLSHPLELFYVRDGGLSSHGGTISILIAIWIFARWTVKIEPGLTWIRLLDFLSIPTAFAACCIRIGNFVNQEILGTPSQLPWAVIFLHPADGSRPVPRHPAQLYEALFYLAVFALLWALSFRSAYLLCKGRLLGLFLLLVFGFRFLVEFLKLEQSHLLGKSALFTMGQWLSIPLILLGALLLFFSYDRDRRAPR